MFWGWTAQWIGPRREPDYTPRRSLGKGLTMMSLARLMTAAALAALLPAAASATLEVGAKAPDIQTQSSLAGKTVPFSL